MEDGSLKGSQTLNCGVRRGAFTVTRTSHEWFIVPVEEEETGLFRQVRSQEPERPGRTFLQQELLLLVRNEKLRNPICF